MSTKEIYASFSNPHPRLRRHRCNVVTFRPSHNVHRTKTELPLQAIGVDQIDQTDRDTYSVAGKTETAAGARTGLFVPESNSLFVAIPHRGSQQAEIRRYQLQ